MTDLSLDPEAVAYWFFRLNGCLTITNFTLHRPGAREGGMYSDVDVYAVRFPHRIELHDAHIGAMRDHSLFDQTANDGRVFVALAEVKKNRIAINQAWRENEPVLYEMLLRLGMFAAGQVKFVADELRKFGCYDDEAFRVQIVGMGAETLRDGRFPRMAQLTWSADILPFIYDRFEKYSRQKSQHENWDRTGSTLYRLANVSRRNSIPVTHFVQTVQEAFEENERRRQLSSNKE